MVCNIDDGMQRIVRIKIEEFNSHLSLNITQKGMSKVPGPPGIAKARVCIFRHYRKVGVAARGANQSGRRSGFTASSDHDRCSCVSSAVPVPEKVLRNFLLLSSFFFPFPLLLSCQCGFSTLSCLVPYIPLLDEALRLSSSPMRAFRRAELLNHDGCSNRWQNRARNRGPSALLH